MPLKTIEINASPWSNYVVISKHVLFHSLFQPPFSHSLFFISLVSPSHSPILTSFLNSFYIVYSYIFQFSLKAFLVVYYILSVDVQNVTKNFWPLSRSQPASQLDSLSVCFYLNLIFFCSASHSLFMYVKSIDIDCCV